VVGNRPAHRVAQDSLRAPRAEQRGGREREGRLDILLDYTVRETNARANMVYPFYLLEGTNLRVDV